MKNKAKELDVDFIGGQRPLTKDEEQKISEYFTKQKLQKAKKKSLSSKSIHRKAALT